MLEIFGPTIQGEGPVAGKPCHFVRLAICEYKCLWCDTKESWTAEHATKMTLQDIAERVALLGETDLITITGGNPCVHPNVGSMMRAISNVMPRVDFSLETQGSIWQDWVKNIRYCVVSPKGPSSGMADKLKLNVLDKFMKEAKHPYLKVVVFSDADYAFARFLHGRYRSVPFYVSSGTDEPYTGLANLGARYREMCERVAHDSEMQDVTVLPQLHKVAWGAEKGR